VKRAIALVALAGCHLGRQSVIGPYARSITRQGNALAVQLCMIELASDELHNGACHVELVPLPPPGRQLGATAEPRSPHSRWNAPLR
jgi:hypothetical protein